MRLNSKNTALANELRAIIQSRTEQIDDGEAVAMVLLWSFLMDHAACHEIDVYQLTRDQVEAFMGWARGNMRMEQSN